MAELQSIDVVCALIVKGGRILITQKPEDSRYPLMWEFPGGKIEAEEAGPAALRREIAEELNCEIEVRGECYMNHHYEYPHLKVNLMAYFAEITRGIPQALEHRQVRWTDPQQLFPLNWVPADVAIAQKLQQDIASKSALPIEL